MQRAHEVLFYVGLGEARYRNLETYSTGMKQRIKLAQALVHDPDLLFLDEPTNGMDPKGREEMLALIADIARNKGLNVILSSHLLPDVEYTCDHVVVLDKGAVATQGRIDGLKGPGGRVVELRVKGEPARVSRRARRRRVRGATTATTTSCASSCPRGTTRRRSSASPRRTASRCATSAPASRRSRTSSPRPWARPEPHAHSRSGLSTLRRPPPRRIGTAWWVIARQQIRTVLSQKRYLILLLLAWIAVRRPRRCRSIWRPTSSRPRSWPTSAQLFRSFLDQQGLFVFLLIVGACRRRLPTTAAPTRCRSTCRSR